MTDEEIKDLYERQIGQAVVDCLQSQNRLRAHVRLVETVLGFAHNIVSEAYEEAAKVADGAACVIAPPEGEQMSARDAQAWVNTWCAHIAASIRALKTRLAGEVKVSD